jgi:Protein of unknown function (DUF3572)
MNRRVGNFKPAARIGAFKPVTSQAMDVDRAEALAATCLVHLTEDAARLSRFMTETGIGPDALSAGAGSREVLVAVLEHVLGDESLLLVVASAQSCQPETLMRAVHVLQKPALGSP